MNCLNFEKWFEQQLIPNLDEPSLIIMDNASYHSGLVEKSPNQCWTKMSLIKWLTSRDITFAPTMMQDQIWEVVKNHIPPKLFRLNELALQHGHRVLRLPPYHCEYNPIEMVSSECKRITMQGSVQFSLYGMRHCTKLHRKNGKDILIIQEAL
ncbi:uncharacterized protein LOC116179183 [Photinus pyralis]|uniref:uncharacterized protein LOC116179183 n=1 Tax=Photinus pyralis TaxID=7054 RepID=UPI0012676042|nr:uncharacterized protein LOC116179183 [Photinus pyralis]